jgi:photosystem II stability/assembly factor-like uncharacterized protein
MENNVPYIVHEAAQARSERHIKRLVIALVVAIVLIFASNAAWLLAWMQYDYTSETTTTETTYQQDGQGLNIIGDSNHVADKEGENHGAPQDAHEEGHEGGTQEEVTP